MASYNPNSPLTTDTVGNSQPNFLGNFMSLYQTFLKNHVSLTDATSPGNHTVVHLLEQPKGFQTPLGTMTVYTKNVQEQTDQLFFRYQGDGTEVQWTNYQIYQLGNQSKLFTFLPGKLLVYFGRINVVNTGNKLLLNPQVARNIVTMNFCPEGTTASYIPTASLQIENNGIISNINLLFDQGIPSYNRLYYFVVANI